MVLYVFKILLHSLLYLLVSWAWWDWPLTWLTNHCPSVQWYCWLGHLTRKIVPEMTYDVLSETINPTIPFCTNYLSAFNSVPFLPPQSKRWLKFSVCDSVCDCWQYRVQIWTRMFYRWRCRPMQATDQPTWLWGAVLPAACDLRVGWIRCRVRRRSRPVVQQVCGFVLNVVLHFSYLGHFYLLWYCNIEVFVASAL